MPIGLASVILAAALASPQASDYYPLTPGLKTEYTDSAMRGSDLQYEVLPAVTVGDVQATPVAVSRGGKSISSVYYRSVGDEIQIVAFDPAKPLPTPQTYFKVGSGTVKWTYKGYTPFVRESLPIDLKGESKPGGMRTVLGKSVDTILVTLDAAIGHDKLDTYFDHQEIVFGKGIGVVEMKESVTYGKQHPTHTLTLVNFQTGSAGN